MNASEDKTNDGLPDKRSFRGFASYDFSNSGYVLIFQSFLYPLVFVGAFTAGQGSGATTEGGNTLWAWLVAASTIVAILLAPVIGRYGDSNDRSRLFARLVLVAGLGAAIVPLLLSESIWGLAIGFLVFNVAFELSQSLYDSFLPDLAPTTKSATRLSTYAWAVGYAGGSLFAIAYLLAQRVALEPHLILAFSALGYLLLSIRAIRFFGSLGIASNSVLKEPRPKERPRLGPPITWTQLLVYWIIADTVAAVLYFAPLYVTQEIGLSTTRVGALLLATQLLAIPFTILSHHLVDRWGQKRTIQASLFIWSVAVAGLAAAQNTAGVIAVMIAIATVIGSTQALLRAHFSAHTSPGRRGQDFGFYAVAQKSASVLAPGIVAIVLVSGGTLRMAFVAISALLVLAILVSRYLPAPQATAKIAAE